MDRETLQKTLSNLNMCVHSFSHDWDFHATIEVDNDKSDADNLHDIVKALKELHYDLYTMRKLEKGIYSISFAHEECS